MNKDNNVITLPNGRPASNINDSDKSSQPKQSADDSNKPLTMSGVNSLGGALHRLHELKAQSVLTPNLEAEVRGLIEFLSAGLIEHASELIACWVAVKTEYEPALNLLATMSNRVNHIHAARAAKANESNTAKAPAP